MPRWFLAAAVAAVALMAGGLAFIVLLDSEPPRAVGPPTVPGRPSAGSPSPPPLPEGVPLAGRPTTILVPEPAAAGPVAPGSTVPPRSIDPIPVERTWPALLERIALRAPRLDDCFDEETQARYGPQAHTALRSSLRPDSGTAVLVLVLESVPGGVRIEDAPLEKPGSASDGLLACAQVALRGLTLDVPGGAPGQRFRVRYPLQRGGVATERVRASRIRRPVKP